MADKKQGELGDELFGSRLGGRTADKLSNSPLRN
jgi:hypothetical protein